MTFKRLWSFPLIFGMLGAFIGLILRYVYTGSDFSFPFKNLLHAHSHVMLLGFLFNALFILVWINFTKGIDKISYKLFIALQISTVLMVVAFIVQGYALYSILFSTIQLWLSYILLIRIWKQLEGEKYFIQLVKIGIVFHFVSSLGPYILGPLMVLGLKESPWYQQAIFFYLHFQFLGLFFMWMFAVLIKKTSHILTKNHVTGLTISLIFLYAHSLDYSFDHWLIYFFGGFGSILLFIVLISFYNSFQQIELKYKTIYFIALFIAITNIAGSFPYLAQLVVDSRFLLIAWLHFLFLGLYVPFIWVFLDKRVDKITWFLYGFSVVLSEFVLIFPNLSAQWFSISSMWLLFIAYIVMFISLCVVHLKYILVSDKIKIS